MAINIKKNQPLGFLPAHAADCGSSYSQPVQVDDIMMLQGCLTRVNSTNLFTDGEFASSANFTLGAGWSISGGNLVGTNVGAQAIWNLTLGLEIDHYYLIQTQVTVTSVGSATPGNGFYFTVNNDNLVQPSDQAGTGCNRSLTATWIYKPSAIVGDTIIFQTNEGTIDFSINYFRIYELSAPEVAILVDGVITDDTLVDSGAFNRAIFFNNTLFTSGNAIKEGTTDLDVCPAVFWLRVDDWTAATTERGCMNLRIYDIAIGNTDGSNDSTTINLRTTHASTLRFYAYNGDNAFGLYYYLGATDIQFRLYLRVYAKMKYSGYPEEKNIFGFSDNSYSIMQAKRDKEYTISVGDAAEHIHDCLTVMRLHDFCEITDNGIQYEVVPTSDYELNQRKSTDNSQATFSVKENQQVSTNYACS